ncbi:MAG: pyridoxine 5'-phosphate synthase [Sedimentisphaeraceae bacterium JB056]
MAVLNVNIDHVATIRQARLTDEPDPVWAASLCELAGANGITTHLRMDRRHIIDRDVILLKQTVASKFNLEMSIEPSIVKIAEDLLPDQVTLVPERREELTTEGGLDCVGQYKKIAEVTARMKEKNIIVSSFIVPDTDQIKACADMGCDAIELHTGMFANAENDKEIANRVDDIIKARDLADKLGLVVHAGHGLTYRNIHHVACIDKLCEFNIGHSIISRAVLVGMERATKEMIELIRLADTEDKK